MEHEYSLQIADEAKSQISEFRKSGNLPLLRKLDALLEELKEHPHTGTGKPEKLKHDAEGRWSRRITQEHRLLYKIEDKTVTVTVVSVKGHYE